MADPAHRITDQVWRIPVAPFDFVNVFAVRDDDGGVTLIDTGTKGAADRIVAGLAVMGATPADVRRIVLTHAHSDHAGAAAEMAERATASVAVHAVDAPLARKGHAPPPDPSTRLGRLFGRLSPSARGFPPVIVAEEFTDGDVLPAAGGLRVVHTPGHTAGHVALLHEGSGVLRTGDSIWNVRGLRWPVKAFCQDIQLHERTAHVLGEMDYDIAAFAHGPHVTDRARERVRGFLADAAQDAAAGPR